MEVHAHSHTERKKLIHYLWEFLMLFLAVFCGFLAENFREHKVEQQREKQYIESMVRDMKIDSFRIAVFIDYNKQQVSGFDSLLENIYHTPYTDSSIRTLYYLKETYTLVGFKVIFSKATTSQLKNSGGLRLIRNRAAADSIVKYDNNTERVEGQGEAISLASQKLLDLSVKVFDGEYVFEYNSLLNKNYKEILSSSKIFRLLTDDVRLMKEYANLSKYKRDVIINYIRQLKDLQNRIPGIIQFLKKEYHL